MSAFLVASSEPSAGKTSIVAGLARNLRSAGRIVTALRLHSGDPRLEGPQADASVYSLLPFLADSPAKPTSLDEARSIISEAPPDRIVLAESEGGLPLLETAQTLSARVIVVALPTNGVALPVQLGDALAGVIVNKVPERSANEIAAAFQNMRVPVLGYITEDALMASFTVGQLHDSLGADVLVDGDFDRLIENVVIAPISADPGSDYFSRFPASAVITRSHKPDLALAALDAGTNCVVIAGGRPPLEYVIDRAQSYEVPVFLTFNNTYETARALETAYSSSKFRGQRKAERIAELVAAHVDPETLSRLFRTNA